MIRAIRHEFPKHIEVKVPKLIRLPIIGWIWLPVWIDYELEFITPKNGRLTLAGMADKLARKINKRIQNPLK